ncbi:MAG: FAD-binding protein [candidate division WOR-3 bacterium]
MTSIKGMIEWPYPVRYGVVNKVDADVLVLGGGIPGSWAALYAAKEGVKVVLVEQADVYSAGPGGADQFWNVAENPCSKISSDELIQSMEEVDPYLNGITAYVTLKDSYDIVLEYEKMGAKVRDILDEYKGAPFRDEETKFVFYLDWENKIHIMPWGQTLRPALYGALRRAGVEMYGRVKVTSLLTEGGKQGSRVVGATGVNVRTGEFYIFRARATVLCTGHINERIWTYIGARFQPVPILPSQSGAGHAAAWRAGAEFTLMEARRIFHGLAGFPFYSVGRSYDPYYGCTIVDATGKEIPYVTDDGKILKSVEERFCPSLTGKRAYLPHGKEKYARPHSLSSDPIKFPELVKKGEYVLPLYLDLPSMPEHVRNYMFRQCLVSEGKGWIIYKMLTEHGFDPSQDMLQCYGEGVILDPVKSWTVRTSRGGLVHDWYLKTNLEGLFVAGDICFNTLGHTTAACSGRWAGVYAARYAKQSPKPEVDENQVEAEMKRAYAPIERSDGINWKELNAGISKVLRTYCWEWANEEMFKIALITLRELEEKEAKEVVAFNPYELTRVLECFDLLTVAQMVVYAGMARKACSEFLAFYRSDYPEKDPPEWTKFITMRLDNGRVEYGELPIRFYLRPPFAPTYKENYEKFKPW